jgi:hypothetical protein
MEVSSWSKIISQMEIISHYVFALLEGYLFVTPIWIPVHVLCEYSLPTSNARPSNRIPISALYTKQITFTLHRLAGLHIHTVFIHHHTTELSLTTAVSVSSY